MAGVARWGRCGETSVRGRPMTRVMTISTAAVALLLVGLCTQFPGFTQTCSECQKNKGPSPSNDSPSCSIQHSDKIDCHNSNTSNASAVQSCNSFLVCPSTQTFRASELPSTCPLPHTCPLDPTSSSSHMFCSGNTCVHIHACPSNDDCLTIHVCPSFNGGTKPDDVDSKPPPIENSLSKDTSCSRDCTTDNCLEKVQSTAKSTQTSHKCKSHDIQKTPQDVSMVQSSDNKYTHSTSNMKNILQDYAFYDEVDPKILAYPDKKKKGLEKRGDSDLVFKFEINDVIDYEQQRAHDCHNEFWSSVIDDLLVESVDKAEKEILENSEPTIEKQQAMEENVLKMEGNVLSQTPSETNREEGKIVEDQQQIMQHGKEMEKRACDPTQGVKETRLHTAQQILIEENELIRENDCSGKISIKTTQAQQQILQEVEERREASDQTQGIKETALQTSQQTLNENEVLKNAIDSTNDVKEIIKQTMHQILPNVTDDSLQEAHGTAKEAEKAIEVVNKTLEQILLDAQVESTGKATAAIIDSGETIEDIQAAMEKNVLEALDRSLNNTNDIVKDAQGDILELKDAMQDVQLEAMKILEERGEEILRKDLEAHEKKEAKGFRECDSQCIRNKMQPTEGKADEAGISSVLNDVLKEVDKRTVRKSYPFLSEKKSVPIKSEETCARKKRQSKPRTCCRGGSDGSK